MFGPFMSRLSTFGETPAKAKPVVVAQAPAPVAKRAAAPVAAARRPVVRSSPARLVHPATPRASVFKGFGAWVDLYDYELDPVRTVRTMRANGVRTLYLQTGRTDTAYMLDPRAWRWVVASHRAGIKVVGWYLPYYADLNRDFARTIQIQRRSYQGQRFDGLGIDIEFRGAVGGVRWNRRVAALEAQVRRAVGKDYPIAAIVPPPLQMNIIPKYWGGFPWAALAKQSDAFLLMSYWSDRTGCPLIRRFCAYEFTAWNVQLTRKLAARPGVLVHIIGGIGGSVSTDQVRDFVRGALASHADGASFYDVHVTSPAVWPVLRQLAAMKQ
jgi:hypothetical protein